MTGPNFTREKAAIGGSGASTSMRPVVWANPTLKCNGARSRRQLQADSPSSVGTVHHPTMKILRAFPKKVVVNLLREKAFRRRTVRAGFGMEISANDANALLDRLATFAVRVFVLLAKRVFEEV